MFDLMKLCSYSNYVRFFHKNEWRIILNSNNRYDFDACVPQDNTQRI